MSIEAALNDLIAVSMNDRMVISHAGVIQDAVEVIRAELDSRQITDAQVEAAAEAMFNETYGESTWGGREPLEDDLYRRRARAALEAARDTP